MISLFLSQLKELHVPHTIALAASLNNGDKILVFTVDPIHYADVVELCRRHGANFGANFETGATRIVVAFDALEGA